MSKSVAFYTLGCKLNYSETSTISRQMEDHGFEKKDFRQGADVYVINTCSVTDNADKKCKKVVKEALKYNPQAYVVIVGCYAQLKPSEIAEIPGVDAVLGAAEKFNLISYLGDLTKTPKTIIARENIKETKDFIPGFSFGDRTRTFLKVQDGCNYFCTFCTIPLARGNSRSETISKTLEYAKEVEKTHVKEVVLTGVNLGDFGKLHDESFFDLIKTLDSEINIPRFRISSIEPNLLSNEIIEFVANSKKFMPHFHIPLQSGSDKILKLMRRRYQRNLYAQRVALIKELMPHASVGVDVIVGFPGETHEDFLDTYHFLNDLDISYLHVFPYSERLNTTAIKMDGVVPVKIRNERAEQLRILSEKKKNQFYRNNLNQSSKVLFEMEEENGQMYGFTENYIKVQATYDPLLVNEIIPVFLKEINNQGLVEVEELPEILKH